MNNVSRSGIITGNKAPQRRTLSLRSRLQIGSALVGAAMALTSPALAAPDPCGAPVDGVVTCSPAGNPYAGISYGALAGEALTINLDAGANVAGPGGVSGSVLDGALTINQAGSVATQDPTAAAIGAQSTSGAIRIDNSGTLTTDGATAHGAAATTQTGSITLGNSGTIETRGNDARGMSALSTGAGAGAIEISNSGSVRTFSPFSTGLFAQGDTADVTVTNAQGGSVTTSGAQSLGVVAFSSSGLVTIHNDGAISTSGANSYGIAASAMNNGLTLTGAGTITTSGDQSVGAHLQAFGGALSATFGSVTTTGADSTAIIAAGQYAVNLTVNGPVSATGAGSQGIIASNSSGVLTLTNKGSVTSNAIGIMAHGAEGLVLNNQGDISTVADNAHAIDAGSSAGATTITNTGALTTRGYLANGVNVLTDDSAITVVNGVGGVINTSGMFGVGIKAESQSGLVSIDNRGVITTTGDGANGIEVAIARLDPSQAVRGDVTLFNRGQITTSGTHALGVLVQTVTGDITADMAAVSTTGEDSDAVHLWTTSGDVNLNASGAFSTQGANSEALFTRTETGKITVNSAAALTTAGENSAGLYAEASGGSIDITSTGLVTTTGASSLGIYAQAQNDITISAGPVTTTGAGSRGVAANGQSGAIKIVTNGLITTSGTGVAAGSSSGSVDILTRGAIATTGDTASGVMVMTDSGDIAITTEGAITTSGESAQAIAADSNTGKVTILAKAALSTSGQDGDAIAAYGQRDVSITTAAVTTAGEGADAIHARSQTGTARIVALGLISTSGDNSDGVDANNDTGDIDITVGSVATTGDNSSGVEADSDEGAVHIVSTGAITTKGSESHGVDASGGGDVFIGVNLVSTLGDNSRGVEARSYDGVARIVSTGAITTEGAESHGIDVNGSGGIVVDANVISTQGGEAHGILARSNSNLTTIKVNSVSAMGRGSFGLDLSSEVGDITVAAGLVRANNTAIRVMDGEGDVTISTTGAVTSATAEAIRATTDDGALVLNIGAASVLTSGVPDTAPVFFGPATFSPHASTPPSVSTIVAEGQTVTINNAGTINQGQRSTISAKGEVTVNNTGLITGNVEFGGGDDVINNTGRFVLAGVSDFGGGSDRFVNKGLVRTQGDATLNRLERFVNAGTIDLADGRAGDVLTISGDYVGQGGRLVVDVDAGATGGPAYDQLVIGGAASGTTTVSLTYKTAARLKPGAALKLVDAAGGSATGAFTLAPEATNIGFARYGVRHDVAADDFFVAVTEGDAVFRSLKLTEGAQSLWRQSADAWTAHTASLRDTAQAGAGRRVWGQVYGSADKRNESLTRVGNGLSQTVDLSYTQDHVGGQMGLDLGVIGDTGVAFGVTGGFIDSKLEFRDKRDSADYKGFNLGAYVGAQHGRYFVNAMAKYDLYDVRSRSVTASYEADLDGRGYGLQVETGARFNGQLDSAAFFLEPMVSLSYSRTDLDSLAAQDAVIDFETLDGLRAKAGARLGGVSSLAQGQLTYYLGAHVVQELAGEDGVRFTSGTAKSAFGNTRVGAFGQYQVGATFTSKAGLTGFVEAKADAGDHYRNQTGRIGVRVAF